MEARSDSLPSIFGVEKSLGAAFDHEAADLAVELRPDHGDVGDRRVGDPHLVAGEPIAAGDFLGAGDHRAGIGAVVGLGEAEAADELAAGELRQIFAALRFRAVIVDRVHDQRRLHRHRRAVAGIDPLDLARDQAVGDIAEAGAAVFFRDGRAEQAERAHLADDRRIVAFVAERLEHARKQLVLRIVARGVAHHALFFGQLALKVERVVPFERAVLDLDRFGFALFRRLRHLVLLLIRFPHPEAPARSAGLEGCRPQRRPKSPLPISGYFSAQVGSSRLRAVALRGSLHPSHLRVTEDWSRH